MKTCAYCGRESEGVAERCQECGTFFPGGAPVEHRAPLTPPSRLPRATLARRLVTIAILLFLIGFGLPAVNLNPWLPGLSVFLLAFLGLVAAVGAELPWHFLACLMGASANVLMAAAGNRILRERAPLLAASRMAVVIAFGVLLPLKAIVGADQVVSYGYYCWVGSAVMILIASQIAKNIASGPFSR